MTTPATCGIATGNPAPPAIADRRAKLGPPRLPWREIVRWTVIGTVAVVLLVLVDLHRPGGGNPLSLIQPGTGGPSTALIEQDFPGTGLPDGLGLDGQQYYAIARDPLDLQATADHLDRPRYRLQRPLLPWLAWALHPSGGGTGLVWALFLVGGSALLIGGLATGALSASLRGPPWLAAVFPLLPGAYWSLRVSVSDALAVALALAAVALAARHRYWSAVVVAVLAVLAKEPMILILGGWVLWRRQRQDVLVLAVPLAVVLAWMAYLRVVLPGAESINGDVTAPFAGWLGAWGDQWSRGHEWVGMVSSLSAVVLGALALFLRRLRHPLCWAVACSSPSSP